MNNFAHGLTNRISMLRKHRPTALPPKSTKASQKTAVIPPPPLQIFGCMDEFATNYNPLAQVDDGSCVYPTESFYVCSHDVVTEEGFNNFRTMMEFDSIVPVNGTYSYSGGNLNGITVIPGLHGSTSVVNSEYLIKDTFGDDGYPYVADDSFIFLDNVVKKNFKISYDFYLTDSGDIEGQSGGGKHVVFLAKSQGIVENNKSFQFGSWSGNYYDTKPRISVDPLYDGTCYIEDPLTDWSEIPQTHSVWRTRTFIKNENDLSLEEDDYPAVTINRPFIRAAQGYVGFRIGPGVRIKNILVEDL